MGSDAANLDPGRAEQRSEHGAGLTGQGDAEHHLASEGARHPRDPDALTPCVEVSLVALVVAHLDRHGQDRARGEDRKAGGTHHLTVSPVRRVNLRGRYPCLAISAVAR